MIGPAAPRTVSTARYLMLKTVSTGRYVRLPWWHPVFRPLTDDQRRALVKRMAAAELEVEQRAHDKAVARSRYLVGREIDFIKWYEAHGWHWPHCPYDRRAHTEPHQTPPTPQT